MRNDWIEQRLKDLPGKSKAGLARHLDLPFARVSEIINGKRGVKAPEVPRIAEYLELPETEVLRLLAGKGPSDPAQAAPPPPPPEEPLPAPDRLTSAPMPRLDAEQDVPILGVTRGGGLGEGDFRFNGDVAGVTSRPHALRGIKDVFCLFVQGESMLHWRKEGDRVYINPARPARPGDHVVVELKPAEDGEPGAAYLKELVARSPDGSLVLAQYNPQAKLKVAGHRVKRVFRVMEWEELLVG